MRWFRPLEVACRCGRPTCDAPTSLVTELGDRLDTLRERLGRPVVITSGLRCRWLNDQMAGSTPDSGHLDGTEVDVACEGSEARWALLEACFRDDAAGPLFPRLGLYPRHVHLGLSLRLPRRVVWLARG